jgi:hypothetical protein
MKTQTDMNKVEIAISVHQQMTEKRPTFELPSAGVFAIVDRGEDGYKIVELVRHPDIYSAIEQVQDGDFDYDGITVGYALETTGWAAPLNKDGEVEGAPSQHPERRRVRLTAIGLAALGAASVLEFADEPGELITDEGQATGMLAEALARLAS